MTVFRVVGTTTRWQADFLALDEVEVVGTDGERFTRSVVRHPGAVVIVPVDADRRHAVLVRQFRAATGDELLEVVAGKRDVDDEPPEATARRELAEELGCEASRLVKLCEFYNSPGFTDEYSHLYCAIGLEALDRPRPVTAEEGAMTTERVALGDVDQMIATGRLVDAKSIIGLVLTRRFLAGEHTGMG